MRRIAVIALTFVCGLVAATTLLARGWGDAAVRSGRSLYPYRVLFDQIAATPPRPAVVWLGDSTLMGASYANVVDDTRFGRSTPTLKAASAGFDFWAMYQLLGAVMELHPRVVVLIANLRVLRVGTTTRTFNDLAQAFPLDELPRTLRQPYSFRGMTAPRLLLTQLLDTPWGEQAFYVTEGLRRNVQTAAAWQVLGPEERERTPGQNMEALVHHAELVHEAYDQPLGPNAPLVRFCGAAVRFAHERGAQVLVVVSPIPTEHLTTVGRYSPDRVAARIAVLRGEVDAAGGRLIDLHAALPQELFKDNDGHFTPEGHQRMAELVWPYVLASLHTAPSP